MTFPRFPDDSKRLGHADLVSPDEVVYSGRRFDVVRMRVRAADGRHHVREIVRHPGAVVIIPWLEGERICLIRNHRLAVGKTLVELPAGTLDGREDPVSTARRELIEETGYRPGRLAYLGGFFMSPGILSERMHVFLATDLLAGPSALEPGEEIENLVVPWSEALRMVDENIIEDAKTIAALLMYERQRRFAPADS